MPRIKPQRPASVEPVYSIDNPIAKKVVSILKAEVERYRNCGRRVGGLGSVQTSYGGRTFIGVGTDWREADSPKQQEVVSDPVEGAITSDNADAILSVFRSLAAEEERESFIDSLMRRLDRDREYASVGYFIALVLFRVGCLSAGLAKAKADLLGDKEYGFSDFLRIIDGLLRFEHPIFSDDLLDDIERMIEGIEEHPFKISQRIAAIRALRLNSGLRTEDLPPNAPVT